MIRIPSGKRRALPFRFWIWWNRLEFKWKVTFTDSCRYDLGHPDQLYVNSLVGIGYLPGHHKHSARFGWRYWVGKDEIELLAYCYVDGQRITKHIGYCKIGVTYNIQLFAASWTYLFFLDDVDGNAIGNAEVRHDNKRKLQYRLGCWFGDTKPSPHEIKIQLENI